MSNQKRSSVCGFTAVLNCELSAAEHGCEIWVNENSTELFMFSHPGVLGELPLQSPNHNSDHSRHRSFSVYRPSPDHPRPRASSQPAHICPTCRRSRRRTNRLDVWNATAWHIWHVILKVDTQGWEFPLKWGTPQNHPCCSNQRENPCFAVTIFRQPQMLDVHLVPMFWVLRFPNFKCSLLI